MTSVCRHHPNCFTSPFSDCVHDMTPSQVNTEISLVRDLELLERYDRMVAQGMTRMGAAANLAAFEHQLVRSILRRLARARVSSSMGWARP